MRRFVKKLKILGVTLKAMSSYSISENLYFRKQGITFSHEYRNDFVINRFGSEIVGKTGIYDFGENIFSKSHPDARIFEFDEINNIVFDANKLNIINHHDIAEFYKYSRYATPNSVNVCHTLNGKIRKTHFFKGMPTKDRITIATACYNNELFLNDYFNSITKQENFKKHLQIVIVNDGSTDKSLSIMKKWESIYPNHIKVIDQKNMGQAEARNVALKYVDTEWVTFIDSDDFVSDEYFYEILNGIYNFPDCKIFTGKIINYNNETKVKTNTHPTNKFCSNKDFSLFNFETEENVCRLSVSVTVLNTYLIKKNDISFISVKPAFEDTDFMLKYYLNSINKNICYISKASYFYRKSNVVQSTTHNILYNTNYYDSFINDGILQSIDYVEKHFGRIPEFVQRIYFEVTQWAIRSHFDNDVEFEDIISEEISNFLMQFYKLLFSKISTAVITKSTSTFLASLQAGINSNFSTLAEDKSSKIEFLKKIEGTYVFAIHTNAREVKVFDSEEVHFISEKNTKFIQHRIFQKDFIKTYYFYTKKHPDLLNFTIESSEIHPIYKDNIYFYENKNNKNILIMDRMDIAGDNGEVLYEHLMNNSYNIRSLKFALKRDSVDWDRLKEKGFDMVEYGSADFTDLYCNSDWVISSHIDQYISDFRQVRSCNPNIKFLFLQHGINMGNVNKWLGNRKFDRIITSGIEETEQLSEFFSMEVVETGLPRFDRVLEKGTSILYMPGWSNYISSMSNGEFEKSDKYKDIISIMTSSKLKTYLKSNDIKMIIKMHPNLLNKHDFTVYNSKYIEITFSSYEAIFSKTDLILTDFSSAFVDKFVNGSRVMFLQTSPKEYYKKQIIEKKDNFSKYGPIYKDRDKFIEDIIENKNLNWDQYDTFRDINFANINFGSCCVKIAKEVLKVGD